MGYNEPKPASIPWNYSPATAAGDFNIWEWTTAHFSAKILEDGNRYVFHVIDKTRGYDKELISSTCSKHEEAINYIREAVAKGYPASAGYLKYGGVLGHSFYIYDGTFRNFGPVLGQQISLFVRSGGVQKKYNGRCDVVGKRVILHQPDGKAFKIPPNVIEEVRAFSGEPINLPVVDMNQKKSRTVSGKVEGGCTGKMGFMAGTVEHSSSSDYCPVHKI